MQLGGFLFMHVGMLQARGAWQRLRHERKLATCLCSRVQVRNSVCKNALIVLIRKARCQCVSVG